MCTYFNTKTELPQSLINDFFSNFGCQRTFLSEGFLVEKKYGGTGLISEKTEALCAELYKRAEAATSSYSVTGDFLARHLFCACD